MSVPLSDIQNDYVRKVERERRRREDELLVLLLLLLGTVKSQVTVAALHGFTISTVIRDLIIGSPNHRGVAPMLSRAMAMAHRDGYRRVGLAAGTRSVERADAGTIADLAVLYEPQAQAGALAMAATLSLKVDEALADRQGATIRQAIGDAFDSAGYTAENAFGLDLATERSVVSAHTSGLFAAVNDRAVDSLTGIEHVSILDERTTDICEERHGLMLPVDHLYWQRNVPSLHWRCRSTLRPIFGDFTPSEFLPVTEPMPGFGMNPMPFAVQ